MSAAMFDFICCCEFIYLVVAGDHAASLTISSREKNIYMGFRRALWACFMANSYFLTFLLAT